MSEDDHGEGARGGDDRWIRRAHRPGRASRVGLGVSVPVCACAGAGSSSGARVVPSSAFLLGRARINAERKDPTAPVKMRYLVELFSSSRHAELPGDIRAEQLQLTLLCCVEVVSEEGWDIGDAIDEPPMVRRLIDRPTDLTDRPAH